MKAWKLQSREKRMLAYLLIVLASAAWKFIPRPWHPKLQIDRAHHRIFSTATARQTDETALMLELLYQAYSNRLGMVQGFASTHPLVQVKLYKDRDEFRWVNPGLGWAEAFYKNLTARPIFRRANRTRTIGCCMSPSISSTQRWLT